MELSEAFLLINERVRNLATYHLEPVAAPIKLNQNENPNDWPSAIKEEIARFCTERPWNRYPNFVPEGLKQRLSRYTGHPAEGILVGNGSNEMLLVLLISCADTRAGVVLCQPTFTVYRLLAGGLGVEAVNVPLKADMSFDVDGICCAVKNKPRGMLIVCSPNNPTGSCLDQRQLRAILAVHTGVLVLDQAYVEFGGFNATALIQEYPNLIITRTFSKAMAGAGLRLGYMLGRPELIAEINKIKLPYNINFFSEHVAEALLSHTEYLRVQVKEIIGERQRLYAFFKTMPLDNVYPSGANFLLVRTKKKNDLFAHLVGGGILVRDVSNYPMLENCLRMSVGTVAENNALIRTIEKFFL
jgi:histidinol-phosphate aminotransferase